MSYDYGALVVKVTALLAKFGSPVTWTRVTRGVFNPDTGMVPLTEVSSEVSGVLDEYTVQEITGTTVQRGDMKLYVVGNLNVGPQDKFVVSGVTYRTVHVEHVAPGGTVVLTIIQVRR